jgi:exodeoxyribonuclease-3
MVRIITLNLNGIRSAWRKGFAPWLVAQQADFVCVQELKAQAPVITEEMSRIDGLTGYFHYADKPGYSGVGIYSRHVPERIIEGIGDAEFDAEGRYLQLDFKGLSVVSLYLPSGSSSEVRQTAKFRFMGLFRPQLDRLRAAGQSVVVGGDWNIAHQEIDLKNWKSNQKNSGFLPEERAWMGQVLGADGWRDTYRQLHPEATDACYTWWSNRGQAWAKNVGWRLDYQLAAGDIAGKLRRAEVYRDERFSDHAPLTVDYGFALP